MSSENSHQPAAAYNTVKKSQLRDELVPFTEENGSCDMDVMPNMEEDDAQCLEEPVPCTDEENTSCDMDIIEGVLRQLIKEQLIKDGVEINDMTLRKALQRIMGSTKENDKHSSVDGVGKCLLPEDTYTLMMKEKSICSIPWLFGMAVWVIQMALSALIFIHQLKIGVNSSPFDIPIRVVWEVRVGQCICIFLALANIKDIYETTHTISHARRIRRMVEGSRSGNDTDMNHTVTGISHIFIPNLLKFISATAVAGITLILIISTDDLISLLTNFAGLTFISDIDNRLYEMAKNNCLGASMKLAVGEDQPLLGKHFGKIQIWIMIFLFAGMLAPFIYFTMTEDNYFYAKYPNCLISPVDIFKFGNEQVSSTVQFFSKLTLTNFSLSLRNKISSITTSLLL